MKKLFVVLGLLLIATMLFVGCKGKTDNSSTTETVLPPQEYSKTGTLQGKIMDAVSGAAIGNDNNSELKIWIIQGTEDRGPNKLINDKNDPLCGEYAFSGIPVDINTTEITFKIVVVKPGYQRFEANVGMLEAAADTGAGTTNLLNAVINMIGNIYLFPLSSTAGDVLVHVSALGIPVPNATVVLQQDASNNTNVAITGNVLAPTAGLISSFTATTDASGIATFSGTNLVLGGRYNAIAEAMTFNAMQLASSQTGTFTVGTSATNQYIAMTSLTGALFATSASNQVPGTITASGVLTVTFNQAIILTTTGFTATGLASDGTATSFLVQAALSTDGLTMTLTPNSVITGTNDTAAHRLASVVSFTPAVGVTPFIIKSTQVNSGLQFNTGTSDLQNITTNAAVSNVVRQLSN